MEKKRAIIFTGQAGQGHLSVAKAFDFWLSCWGYNTQILNLIPSFNEEIYKLLLKSPKTYKSLFWSSNFLPLAKIMVKTASSEFEKKAKCISPSYEKSDLVISTYPFIHPQAGKVKIMILPDPIIHATYCAPPLVDFYFTFWPEAAVQTKNFGIPEEKIVNIGPLIRPAFYQIGRELKDYSQKYVFKKQLGINSQTKLGLIMAGGDWIERSFPYLKLLVSAFKKENILFAFVCGKNQEFFRKMTKKYQRVKIFKFLEWLTAEQMATWMAASDFALAFSLAQMSVEAGLSCLPIYIFQLIEGQEEGYRKVIEERKVGLFIEGNPQNQVKTLKNLLPQTEENFAKNLALWQRELLAGPEKLKKILEEITK